MGVDKEGGRQVCTPLCQLPSRSTWRRCRYAQDGPIEKAPISAILARIRHCRWIRFPGSAAVAQLAVKWQPYAGMHMCKRGELLEPLIRNERAISSRATRVISRKVQRLSRKGVGPRNRPEAPRIRQSQDWDDDIVHPTKKLADNV